MANALYDEIERLKAQNKELYEALNNLLPILQYHVKYPECYVAIGVAKSLINKYESEVKWYE